MMIKGYSSVLHFKKVAEENDIELEKILDLEGKYSSFFRSTSVIHHQIQILWFRELVIYEDWNKIIKILKLVKNSKLSKDVYQDYQLSLNGNFYYFNIYYNSILCQMMIMIKNLEYSQGYKYIETITNKNFQELFELIMYFKANLCYKIDGEIINNVFDIIEPRTEFEEGFYLTGLRIKVARKIEKYYLKALDDKKYLTPLHLIREEVKIRKLLEIEYNYREIVDKYIN